MDHHAGAFLAGEELALEQFDQHVALAGMQGVLPQFVYGATFCERTSGAASAAIAVDADGGDGQALQRESDIRTQLRSLAKAPTMRGACVVRKGPLRARSRKPLNRAKNERIAAARVALCNSPPLMRDDLLGHAQ